MSDPAAFREVSDTLTEELREDWFIDTQRKMVVMKKMKPSQRK